MNQDVASQVAGFITSAKVFGSSDNIRHGKYKFLILNIVAKEVETENGRQKMAFWEFEVLEAQPNPQVEGDRVDYISPQQPGVGPLKDDGMKPNLVGSKCALKVNFDGPGGRSAGANIKSAMLALFGKQDGEISEVELNKTWIDLTRERDVAQGQLLAVDPMGQPIYAQTNKRAQPARGMVIWCTTRTKKKKTPNAKGMYVTLCEWTTRDSPVGRGENADAPVAQRRARAEAFLAAEAAAEQAAQAAQPQFGQFPAQQPQYGQFPAQQPQFGQFQLPQQPQPQPQPQLGQFPSQQPQPQFGQFPAQPQPQQFPQSTQYPTQLPQQPQMQYPQSAPQGAQPTSVMPPTMPSAAPPAPSTPAAFVPPAPWEPHPTAAGWFWSSPLKGGDNSIKSEADLRTLLRM